MILTLYIISYLLYFRWLYWVKGMYANIPGKLHLKEDQFVLRPIDYIVLAALLLIPGVNIVISVGYYAVIIDDLISGHLVAKNQKLQKFITILQKFI